MEGHKGEEEALVLVDGVLKHGTILVILLLAESAGHGSA